MNRLKNKKIIVIGGTSGIGKAIVEQFSKEGAIVAFCGRAIDKGKNIESSTQNTKYIYCDITKKEEIKSFFLASIDFLGGLDAAVNNAGTSGEIIPFHQTTDDMLHQVINTNFFGIWHCLQQEIRYFLENNLSGSIVNMSSTSGLIGNALGLSPYSCSKHAIVGLTKSCALEYSKSNIRINAICPGFVDTPMTDKAGEISSKLKKRIPMMQPMGRVASPLEIASAAVYLCSDESSFTTGSCMVVDGGLTV